MTIKSAFSQNVPSGETNIIYQKQLVIYQNPSDYSYIKGYLDAARKIASKPEGFAAGDDILVKPFLFMIRHFVELMLKYYLYKIINHYKKCKLVKSNIHNAKFGCLNKHKLIPIFNEVCRLRAIPSPHQRSMLDYLRDDLQFLDDIDPDADAFRFARSKSNTEHKIHDQQRWIDVEKIISEAANMDDVIIAEMRSEDMVLCEDKLLTKAALARLKKFEADIRAIIEWKNTLKDEEGIIFSTTSNRSMKDDATKRVIERAHSELTLKILFSAMAGIISAKDGGARSAAKLFPDKDDPEPWKILQRTTIEGMESACITIRRKVERITEIDRLWPLPAND